MLLALLLLPAAQARPTDGGGMWTYDETDTVVSLDGPAGRVRVWYSTSGTNAVLATDADDNGLPDFAEDVAATAEAVLEGFDTLGVVGPLPDHGKGGDDRLDAYLVDFAGNADGNWATEGCDGSACYGYFQMENDFSGYGYPSLHEAVTVLTSHELFHGVQAAYGSTEESWFLEGTATWAEDYFQPGIDDFIDLCAGYLSDSGRSLYEPPSGPVPAFAYGTALWWWFLSDRYGDDVMVDLLYAMGESTDGDSLLAGMVAVETERGGTLREDWVQFTDWNLATAARSGTVPSYPFAADLRGLAAAASGDSIVEEERFYPLSATYFQLKIEEESELFVATDEAGPDLSLRVFPINDAGDVAPLLADVAPDGEAHSVGVAAAGTYWLVVSNPTLADNSTKVTVCFGDAATVAECAPADTGGTDTGGDTGDSGTTDSDDRDDSGGSDTGEPPAGGCGCAQGSAPAALGLVGLALAVARRRRRA